jgi:ribosomal protein S12 methylthiotransferase accessory factor
MQVSQEEQLQRTMHSHPEEEPARGVPLERLKHLVSPLLGICRDLTRLPSRPGEPRVSHYGAELARMGPRAAHQTRDSCCGTGYTDEVAQAAALGEVAETWCAGCMDPERVRLATWRELSREHAALEPERFALYSERQHQTPGFPYHPFTRDTPVGWVEGWSLVRRAPVWVPASRVYLPYEHLPGEPSIGFQCSTGLAAGGSLAQAILSGLCEDFERDAFTLFWLDELPARRVHLEGSRLWRRFEAHFAVPGYEYRIYDVTNDLGVPTALVLLISPSAHGELYVAGAASRPRWDQAVEKALLETVQGRPYVLYQLKKEPDWQPGPDFSNVVDFAAHGRLYTSARELVPVLLGMEERVTAHVPLASLPRLGGGDLLGDIAWLAGRLAERGYEAVVMDLTTPDMASLGLSVVRVLTPELQPLHGDHHHPHLGGERVREVPVRLGVRSPHEPPRINPYPHPFA